MVGLASAPAEGRLTGADSSQVERHLQALERCLAQLRGHSGRPISALAELDEQWAVERGLQLAAQNAIDIATHIATAGNRSPADYTQAFDALCEMGILPTEFTVRFRNMAGFRNVLVHGYLDIDDEVVHFAINAGLDEFTAFVGYIRGWMRAQQGGS